MIGIKDQYFGVEIEMTGITREKAAEVLGDYFPGAVAILAEPTIHGRL